MSELDSSRKRARCGVATVWTLALSLTLSGISGELALAGLSGGKGVARVPGGYELRRGLNRAPINEIAGSFFYSLQWAVVIAIAAAVVFGVWTYRRHGTIRIDELRERLLVPERLVAFSTASMILFVMTLVARYLLPALLKQL